MIKMDRNIKVVSFDFDGTLVDHSFMEAFWNEVMPKVYADEKGMGLKEAMAYVFAEYDRIGRFDLRWYLPSFWIKHFGLKASVDELLLRSEEKLRVYPDVQEALKELRSLGFAMVVISSAPKELIEFGVKRIGDFFRAVLSSVSDYGLIRKLPNFYLHVCNRLGVKPYEVVHIGDDYIYDYSVPKSLGIEALLIRREGGFDKEFVIKDLRDLKTRLIRH